MSKLLTLRAELGPEESHFDAASHALARLALSGVCTGLMAWTALIVSGSDMTGARTCLFYVCFLLIKLSREPNLIRLDASTDRK